MSALIFYGAPMQAATVTREPTAPGPNAGQFAS